jgi:uncharacterized GH25 family protein
MRPTLVACLLAASAAAPATAPALAHELVVAPEGTRLEAGATLPFAVHSTHVLLAPEEMEAPEDVAASLVPAGGGEAREVALEAAGTHLAGEAEGAGDGPVWLVAHRLAQTWSRTPEGWSEGGRDANPDAATVEVYEKFSKTLLNAGGPGYDAPLGHRLEIVPAADPADLAAGDDLPVRVLLDGEPIQATVHATFAGFSDRPGTWAYVTETAEEGGEAVVTTWAPGLWFVRAEHTAPGGEGVDGHVLRAVTSFEVAG